MWFRGLRVSKGLKAQRVDLALKELKALRVRLGNEDLKGLLALREGLAPSMTWTMATGSMTLSQTSMTSKIASTVSSSRCTSGVEVQLDTGTFQRSLRRSCVRTRWALQILGVSFSEATKQITPRNL